MNFDQKNKKNFHFNHLSYKFGHKNEFWSKNKTNFHPRQFRTPAFGPYVQAAGAPVSVSSAEGRAEQRKAIRGLVGLKMNFWFVLITKNSKYLMNKKKDWNLPWKHFCNKKPVKIIQNDNIEAKKIKKSIVKSRAQRINEMFQQFLN